MELRGCSIRYCGPDKGFGVFATAGNNGDGNHLDFPFALREFSRNTLGLNDMVGVSLTVFKRVSLNLERLDRYRHGCSARFGYHADEGSPRPVGWAEMQGLVRGGRRRRPFPHDGVSYGGTRASELGVEAVGILSSIACYLFALRDST